MKHQLFSIGHSTLPLDRFLALLARHRIESLVDIRRFPGSRKFPHMGRQTLARSLRKAGIEYHWLEDLGGRRPSTGRAESSPNRGLHNQGFRNYADYMLTDPFRRGIGELLVIVAGKRTAMMCAEAVFWRCHRR